MFPRILLNAHAHNIDDMKAIPTKPVCLSEEIHLVPHTDITPMLAAPSTKIACHGRNKGTQTADILKKPLVNRPKISSTTVAVNNP